MHNLKNLFCKDSVEHISNLIEEKMPILRDLPEFKQKDEKLAISIEDLEKTLPQELKEKFDNMQKLTYQVEEYYFTLAYFLGAKYGRHLKNL